jgi:hypothetical protein
MTSAQLQELPAPPPTAIPEFKTIPSSLLFGFMVETYVAMGITIYSAADPFRKIVPQKPFLWIPRLPAGLGLDILMTLIEVNGMRGTSFLEPDLCTDLITPPDEPYLMFDIEDGSKYLDTKPSVSEGMIVREGRSPYLTLEGIFHAILFPATLQNHGRNLCGSRHRTFDVPDLFLGQNGPRLQPNITDYSHPHWGAPSCRARYTASDLGACS